MYLCTYDSPLGTLTLASDGPRLCGLWLEGQKHYADKLTVRTGGDSRRVEGPDALDASVGLRLATAWLDAYFAGGDPGALPPVALRGTPFQELVWEELTHVPYATLTTYGAIAQSIEGHRGTRTSARAVGAAVGRNPISIIVPCHRVVGSAGSLTGYAGGVDRKVWLLQHEGVAERLWHR